MALAPSLPLLDPPDIPPPPASSPPPSVEPASELLNEPQTITPLAWDSYGANQSHPAGDCAHQTILGGVIDPSASQVLPVPHDERSENDQQPESAPAETGLVATDCVPQSFGKVCAGSEISDVDHRGKTLLEGDELVSQPADNLSNGDALASEPVKRVHFRLKKFWVSPKANLLSRREESKLFALGESRDAPEPKSINAIASKDNGALEKDVTSLHRSSGEVAELPGTCSFEGLCRSANGGMPADPPFGHTEVEPMPPHKLSSRACTSGAGISLLTAGSRLESIDPVSDLSAMSKHVNAHPPTLSSKRSSNDRTNDKVSSSSATVAVATKICAAPEGLGSEKGQSGEDSSRKNTVKEHKYRPTRGRPYGRDSGVANGSVNVYDDGGTMSEISLVDMKEQTVLETLLPDEPPGYTSAECSDSSHRRLSQRVDTGPSQSEDSEGDDTESSQSEGSETGDTESSHSQAYSEEVCGHFSPVTPRTPGDGAYSTDQVPSVLCDAEGKIWHVGKRAEKQRGNRRAEKARGSEDCRIVEKVQWCEDHQKVKTSQASEDCHTQEKAFRSKDCRTLSPSHTMAGEKLISDEIEDCAVKSPPAREGLPSNYQVELNWKWPSSADYTINIPADANNRCVVVKERSVFIGCIPDGIGNMEEVLGSLMKTFLQRFDFAPAALREMQLVVVHKDFAFVELATDKIAQIILAANQLDVFEWGANGHHFNIEGCIGTHTAVRPLIEYVPLKPARVLFIANIPKSRWQKDSLEAFFSGILKGSDGQGNMRLVVSIYLLPESCDAYLELASELIADALIYKCNKNPRILKDIGEDVFMCRDASSTPMMSRHTSSICPQRSLFVGLSLPGIDSKIEYVRKVLDDVLSFILRKSNHRGYLEFISFQPGTDYAFFQFNSEATADAIMDEYIDNTQLFVCKDSSVSFIILRPPKYIRPGARYQSDDNRPGQFGRSRLGLNRHQMIKGQWRQDRRLGKYSASPSLVTNQGFSRPRSNFLDDHMNIAEGPRKFGAEPGRKPDCVMSIGVTPAPLASWNGMSFSGDCLADSNSRMIVEGLPKGLSYKLLRGALNELFERTLYHTGLLEIGMLILRYLDRDESSNVVGYFPNADFVYALLSFRNVFVLAGNEIKLLPKDQKSFHWRMNPAWVPGELSFPARGVIQGRRSLRNCAVDGWAAPSFFRGRKRGYLESEDQYHPSCDKAGRGPAGRRKEWDRCTDEWYQSDSLGSVPPFSKQGFRGHFQETSQQRKGTQAQHMIAESHWQSAQLPDFGNPNLRQAGTKFKNTHIRRKHLATISHKCGTKAGPRFFLEMESLWDRIVG